MKSCEIININYEYISFIVYRVSYISEKDIYLKTIDNFILIYFPYFNDFLWIISLQNGRKAGEDGGRFIFSFIANIELHLI